MVVTMNKLPWSFDKFYKAPSPNKTNYWLDVLPSEGAIQDYPVVLQ